MAHKGQTARFLYRGSFPNGEVFDDCEGTPPRDNPRQAAGHESP